MSTTRDEVHILAQSYVAAGLSVIPIRADGTKAPALGIWTPYQEAAATSRQLYEWFATQGVRGIAVIGGAVSGNLEILDFDHPEAYPKWIEACADHNLREVAERLLLVETPKDGRHLYYRCAEGVEGNRTLARMRDRTKYIETRGEGGYALLPGSPLACHPNHLPYKLLRGDFQAIPHISAEERDGLLAMARILNEYVAPDSLIGRPAAQKPRPDGTERPGEHYNREGKHFELLEKHGWTHIGYRGDVGLWRRPGKNRGLSATSNYAGSDLFFPWTSSAAPLEPERSYTRFGLYAALEHNGDFKAAAAALGKLGYGEKPRKPTPASTAKPEAAKSTDAEPAPSAHLRFFPHTDVGNAERLQALHGDDLRYCHELGQWYIWDGSRWRTDRTGEINRRAVDMVRTLYTEAGEEEDLAKRTAIGKYARSCESRSSIEAAVHICKSLKGIPATVDDFDADRLLINAANGTIDLRTGELRPHQRADLMTKLVPVAYDPAALCPAWDSFLTQILPDETVRTFIQRAAGYSLTGEVIDECLVFLHGSGSNGKSTLVNTLLTMMGDYALQSAPDMLIAKDKSGGANNDIARLFGQRLVVTSEPGESVRLAEGLVKQITSKDRITARFLHKEFFDFWPTHKTWFCANHKPQIRGADNGIWRRIKLIPFDIRIADDQKDTHLQRKLEADLPGILAWAVRGCLDWREHGLGEPAAVKAATDSYRGEMDVLKSFLEDCCVIRPSLSVVGTSLWTAYNRWCDDNAEKPVGKQTFGRRLQEAHAIVPGKNIGPEHSRGWQGIALRSDLSAEEIDKVDIVDVNSTFFLQNLFHEEKNTEIVSTMSTLSTTSLQQSQTENGQNSGKKWGGI
jgi:P4 family phage/plasmid primase-like protien